ncbi:LacI family DNA-binding transcriptional regulator [Brevibacillus migulae]|uniref:LacI family DNA-binding transcriptional regulator n=1 Tax=Brevibacillus migulae TaxID=1644114 RepID=UPI0014310123|nr:LacI family DNA-binding transcriptional regulator [Brevibacillus migulae]
MRITIKDIAELCGVSVGTVDRALNNRPGISAKTKKKILQIAEEMHYRPDHTARSLAKGRTMTLGVILFDVHNRSFAQLMNAIADKANEFGYFVDLVLTDKNQENELRCLEHLITRKVDGIILFTVNKGKEFEQFAKRLQTPIVTICNRLSEDWNYVGIDDRQAMKDAVQYIIDKGYERYIYICPPLAFRGKSNIYTQEERYEGCKEALREAGLEERLILIEERNYIHALDQIALTGSVPRTAIICSCDYYALEVMNALKAKGLRIPEDIGLMGFDNIDVLKYVTPPLTTVEYAVEEIGVKAVECLVGILDRQEEPAIPLLPYRIIPGATI